MTEAVKNKKSIRGVLDELNLKATGGNYDSIKKYIAELNLDTSHFTGQIHRSPQVAWNKIPPEEVFKLSNKRLHPRQRKYIFDNNLLGDCCSKCSLSKIWQNEPIILEIDHVNGNPHDNRIENLRLLCPNCHSQTPTYRGKNKKNNNIKNGIIPDMRANNIKCNYKNNCIDCQKKVYRGATRCRDCNNKLTHIINN